MTNKKRHTRNPIKHHGARPTENFGMLAEDLIRDGSLTAEAFRVYALLVSHKTDYEESIVAIAARYGWATKTARKAMRDLQDQRLVVTQHFVNTGGKRAFENYHVARSRRFTAAEVTKYSTTITLQTPQGDGSNGPGGEGQNALGGWSEMAQGDGAKRPTKEYQSEYQLEDHLQKTNLEEGNVTSAAVPADSWIVDGDDVDQEGSALSLSKQREAWKREALGSAGDVTLSSPQQYPVLPPQSNAKPFSGALLGDPDDDPRLHLYGKPCIECGEPCTADNAIPNGTDGIHRDCFIKLCTPQKEDRVPRN